MTDQLQKAAENWAADQDDRDKYFVVLRAFIAGAQWKEQQGGIGWVKASERLPDGHLKVYIKYNGDAFIGHKNYSENNPQMVFESITRTYNTNDCEWLDESGGQQEGDAALKSQEG